MTDETKQTDKGLVRTVLSMPTGKLGDFAHNFGKTSGFLGRGLATGQTLDSEEGLRDLATYACSLKGTKLGFIGIYCAQIANIATLGLNTACAACITDSDYQR
jgi:hypothetical protein